MQTAARTRSVCRTLLRRAALPSQPSRGGQLHGSRFLSSSASGNSASQARYVVGGLALALGGAVGYALGSGSRPSGATTAPSTSSVPQYGTPEDFKAAIRELQRALPGDMVTDDEDVLQEHGFSTNDYHPGILHSVVIYPRSTEDVVKVVQVATKYRMPVIPYSGGTSLEGHTRGHTSGGICLDMSLMDRILELHEADSDVVCQPGVSYMDLNDHLKKKGIALFLPLDPGPGATVGGMFNTGCSGTNAVRYGTAKGEWFLNATIVLPSGEVIKTRRRARKSSAGFDVTKLFIGSEGTLGIVTELTIKLAPLLPTSVAIVQFPNVHAATSASAEIVNSGAGIQCIELCDSDFMAATNKFGMSARKYPERDSLYLKLQGPTAASIAESARIARAIAERHGGSGFALAQTEKEADDLWKDRKNALWSSLSLIEGAKGWSTDVCVPVSRLPDLVTQTKEDVARSGITCTIVGHVGDGNFHCLLLFRNDDELKAVHGLVHRMVERAIAMDGTCTGEHGVGIGKKEYLNQELGEGTVRFMKKLKRTIDPLGLFNPGKLYPDEPGPGHPEIADQFYEKK